MFVLRNLLLWIVLALLGLGLAALAIGGDPGYVLVRYGGYDYTTTLVYAIGIGLAAVLALWLLWWLLSLPFRSWSRHRDRQARASLGDGLEALHQGRRTQADKLLAQAAQDPHGEAAARIATAHAAHASGEPDRARRELEAFGDRHPASRAIAAAELALADGRPTDALVALDAPAAQPLPPRGLVLRAEALAVSGQAGQAYELLGALRRQHALPEARLAEYETAWAAAALREPGDGNVLADRWEALPKPLRTEPAVVAAYADRAAALHWDEAATRSLEHALDARWDESLAERYGVLPLGRLEHRRATAERWLGTHPDSPALLLTLARLAREEGRWDDADGYLRRAIAEGGGAGAWEELGDAWAARGDDTRARQCYRNALRAGRGAATEPVAEGGPHGVRRSIPPGADDRNEEP